MKEKQEKKLTLDYDEIIKKQKKIDDIITCAICSVGFSAATASIVSFVTGCIDKTETLPYFIVGGSVSVPVFYILLRKLRKKIDDDFRKDMVSAANLFSMMGEVFKQDRVINENTSVFLNELELKFKTNDISMPTSDMFCINKLLYLVNVNYYDEISKSIISLTREKLIDHIINQIIVYYKNNDKKTFDENDAKEIISHCLLIPPQIKEEIINEFQASKIKINNEIDYAIAPNDTKHIIEIEPYEAFLTSIANNKGYNFDITSESDLNSIILAASNHEYYRQYGNPDELVWDMDFLSRVLTLTASNYRQELIEYHKDYSNLALASSLITKSITYALVNKRKEVGQREIISTFKNWNYVPFTVQDKILTKLFEEDGIDYNLHPYRERRDPTLVKKTKVIKLSDYFLEKSSTTKE